LPVYPVTFAVGAASPLPGPGELGDVVLPLALMEEAVAEAGCRERRRRLLPAVAVMVFVLGCCLFCGEGYGEVARKLAGWLAPLAGPAGWHLPGTSALARARARLGAAPFEWLFARLAGPAAGLDTPGAAAFGRLLLALDGTRLDVPFTAANVAAFGPPPRGGGAAAGGYPQARLVTLAGCGARGLADAVFGPRTGTGSSEQALARQVAARGRLRAGMLVIADRSFCGHPVAAALAGTGADVLIRARSDQYFPVLEVLADGSYRSVLPDPDAARARWRRNGQRRRRRSKVPPDPRSGLPGLAIRVIEADITITAAGQRLRTERCRLITTLADPAAAPAAAIAACYAQRWEIENSYKEIKVFTRGPGVVLRSRHPAGVTQEIWALLCACQLTAAARARAAAAGGHDPDRISYTITLRALRRALTTHSPAANITAEALATLLPPTRRRRSYPRLTGTSTAQRRAARASHTTDITYKITIVAPAQASDLPGP
jgi:Insertion element 4 transposase N-terminal/Transposase DDE domain